MSGGAVVTSLGASGAGRSLSLLHPQSPDLLGGNGTLGKYLGQTVAVDGSFGAINTGGFGAIEVFDGQAGIRVTTSAAANFSGVKGFWTLHPFIRYTKPQSTLPDPYQAMEFGAMLAVDSYAAQAAERNTDDIGVSILDNFNNGVNGNLGKGILFGPTAKGAARLHARAVSGAGLVVDEAAAVPAGFDATRWHVYALRVVGATATDEATVQGFIDGQAATSKRKWTTDGLPIASTNAWFSHGMVACLSAWAGGGLLHYAGSYYYAGPAESQL